MIQRIMTCRPFASNRRCRGLLPDAELGAVELGHPTVTTAVPTVGPAESQGDRSPVPADVGDHDLSP